jgi:hypothetical protein
MFEAGCRYHARSVVHTGAGSEPLVVIRESPRPGTEIPASGSVELSVRPATSRYGRCRAPAEALALIDTGTAIVL